MLVLSCLLCNKQVIELQSDLSKSDWEQTWQMNYSADKYKVLQTGYCNKKANGTSNGMQLKSVDSKIYCVCVSVCGSFFAEYEW